MDSQTQTIRLMHHTTKEYLARRALTLFPDAHSLITHLYLHYLSSGPLTVSKATNEPMSWASESHPLAGRAALYWGEHARESNMSDTLKTTILRYLEDEEVRNTCAEYIGLVQPLTRAFFVDLKEVSALHLASYHGLTAVAQELLEKGNNPDVKDSNKRTPMSWAAERGFHEVVQ